LTHIVLAATSLPFILTTAYKALSADYPGHRKMAKRVWPVWFYVSVTGVVVYFMISPYY
jgi:putative membrane protein